MAGIDFDRQVFIPPTDQPEKPPSRIIGVVILVVAILGIGFVGYKLISDTSLSGASAEANSLQQIQQQLADMKERIDLIEKKHKAAPEATVVTPPSTNQLPPARLLAPNLPIRSSAASALNPQRNPDPTSQPSAARSASTNPANDAAARESWQATTDRLADVVGAVGSQEGEINQTRDQLNQLLAQTRRSALQFELTRGAGRQSVGPVELLLKGSDPRSQRYTVCVYLNNKCIELKDRVLDEVVVFVLARGTPPLELVATRISRDEIVGYLEVPTEKVAR